MSKDAEIIKSLTMAGVPRSCWSVSTKDTGRIRLRDFSIASADRANFREIVACAYVRGVNSSNVIAEVEQLAKELVLAGHRTKYVAFNKLVSEVRKESADNLCISRVYGSGAIVVPSIPTAKEVHETHTPYYLEAVDYLVSHAYEGGVLVVGGKPVVTQANRSGFPELLERLLLQSAELFEVS